VLLSNDPSDPELSEDESDEESDEEPDEDLDPPVDFSKEPSLPALADRTVTANAIAIPVNTVLSDL